MCTLLESVSSGNGLRDDSIYPNVNRKEYAHTNYPPVAQIFFFVVTRVTQSILGFKGVLVVLDLVTMGLVAANLRAIGQPAERVIVYAWHPLPIFEFGGSGHIDALMICFIALALFARAHQKFGIAGFCAWSRKVSQFFFLSFCYRLSIGDGIRNCQSLS